MQTLNQAVKHIIYIHIQYIHIYNISKGPIGKLLDLLSSRLTPCKPSTRLWNHQTARIHIHITSKSSDNEFLFLKKKIQPRFGGKVKRWSSIALRICICKTSKFNISPEIAVKPLHHRLFCLNSHFVGKIDKVVRNKSSFWMCSCKIQSNSLHNLNRSTSSWFHLC